MNENLNDVVLRPRFKIELNSKKEPILNAFETDTSSDFIVNRVDDHVFIKFPKSKQRFFTPQLHLEINNTEHHKCYVYGLFGPSPTVWTMFMFLHFVVAGFFIAFAIWAYSNYALKTDIHLQVWGMIAMLICWFVLYFAGLLSKTSNQKEMTQLYNYMSTILDL